jgi:hypothetical protein
VAIARDVTGPAVKMTTAATSATVDITTAAAGSFVFCLVALGLNEASLTFTGWTQLLAGDESTATHYGLFWRQKIAGDTTFTVSWPSSTKGTIGWVSYTGLNAAAPQELAAVTLHTTGTSFVSPSLTPSTAAEWALFCCYARDTTLATDLPDGTAWAPDAALTELLDASNQASSGTWVAIEFADSGAAVTQAAHSYTAVSATAESHGAAFLLFLNPAAGGPAIWPQPGGQAWRRRFRRPQFSWQLPPPPAAGGPPVYPLGHPVMARLPLPARGRVTSRDGTYGGSGPPVRAADGPVQAKRLPARGGSTASRDGTYGRAGPPVKAAEGPVRGQPAAHRGGQVTSRDGTFTAVSLGSGPPVYPLHSPVQARRLPQRGGHVTRATGTYGNPGPPVRPADGPVRAQPAAQRGGHTAGRAGTFTAVVTGSGPQIYPLGHPVMARRFPARGGSASQRTGTYARTGPPVPPLHRPVRSRLPGPVLTGRIRSTLLPPVASVPIVVPFTVGTLTATDTGAGALTAAGTSSALTASTAPSGTLTAVTAASGGAEYGSTYSGTYGPQEGTLTATDTRTGGPA